MTAYLRLRRVPPVRGEPVLHLEMHQDMATGETKITRAWEGFSRPQPKHTLSPDGDG